jgi:hypothetical protein
MIDEPTVAERVRRAYAAVASQISDPSDTEVPFHAGDGTPVRHTHRVTVAVTVIVVLITFGTGVAVLHHRSSRPLVVTTPAPSTPLSVPATRPRHAVPVIARVVLPSRTMITGSTVNAKVVIDNHTGHALTATGCLSLFQIVLSNANVHQQILWPSCAQRFVIPTGTSSYPVKISVTYLQCSNTGRPQGTIPTCEHGPPPLPQGDYQARLFQNGRVAPTPPPVSVHVVAPTRTP